MLVKKSDDWLIGKIWCSHYLAGNTEVFEIFVFELLERKMTFKLNGLINEGHVNSPTISL